MKEVTEKLIEITNICYGICNIDKNAKNMLIKMLDNFINALNETHSILMPDEDTQKIDK